MPLTAPGAFATASRLAVLLFTDIVGSTQIKSNLGDAVYSALLQRHNEIFESSLDAIPGASIIKHTGDGYFGLVAVSTTR